MEHTMPTPSPAAVTTTTKGLSKWYEFSASQHEIAPDPEQNLDGAEVNVL